MKLRLTLLALSLLALSIGAFAQPAASKPQDKAKAATKAAVPQASRIFIDPVTGESREPTPEEVRALQESQSKTQSAQSAKARKAAAVTAPREMVNADGAVGVDATEEQASFSVAHLHADGTVSHSCVDGAHTAKQAVKKGTARRPAATSAASTQ